MDKLEPDLDHIGFVGLGKMGGAMCRRLLAGGVRVVGFDGSPAALDSLATTAGFTVASTIAEVGARSDVVILMLPDSDAVDTVTEQLLSTLPPGAYVLDMSSSIPARTRALAQRCAVEQVVLVDAPVSGGVAGATSGTLTIMVGGPPSAVAALRPVLDRLGGRVEHVGDSGAGHAVKALNNLMSAAHLSVTSEALLAARRFGLDLEVVLKVVNGSSGRSGSSENKWPNFVLSDSYDSGFAASLMSKDVGIALDLIDASGVDGVVSRSVGAAWRRAASELPRAADHTEIVKWIEQVSASDVHPGTDSA
jgi:3-hydroxyisobutyrate dehydrogenase